MRSISPPAVEPIAVRELPNGLTLELTVSSDPAGADVAVCPSDSVGSEGTLNGIVLRAVGIDPASLRRVFKPLATLVTTGHIPVLAIQTVGGGQRPEGLLRASLREGLRVLESVSPRRRIWVPLVGTGAGGFAPAESARVIVGELAAWATPGPTEAVELAAPSESIAAQVRDALLEGGAMGKPGGSVPDSSAFTRDDVERHVWMALQAAWLIKRGQRVGPLDVLVAVISVARSVNSAAFTKLASLVGLKPVARAIEKVSYDKSIQISPSRYTPDLARWLPWPRDHAGDKGSDRLWGRDLVTAALLCEDAEMSEALDAAGTPLNDVRERWFTFVTADEAHRTRDEWRAWWHAAGVPPTSPRRAGYSTETDQGEDKLGVAAEAAAFARLILDQQVTPPLSIGLLGDWGSGKSFFIEQIRKQVGALRGQPGLLADVVEIEFNAWHASDANLWASLVTHVFDEIWKQVDVEGAATDPAAARQQLEEELKQAKGALHESEAQMSVARRALEEAEQQLRVRRSQLAWSSVVSSIASEDLQKAADKAGWHAPLEIINEIQDASRCLGDTRQRLRLMLTTLVECPLATILWPALMAIGLFGVAAVLVHQGSVLAWLTSKGVAPDLAGTLAKVLGALTAIVAPLKSASARVKAFAKSIDSVADEYEAQLMKMKPEEAGELRTARRELASAEEAVAAATTHLAELQNRLAALEPGRRLQAFLLDRVQSSAYRAQQGIIALVHKDFQQLSERMKDWRAVRLRGDAPILGRIKPVDRIVLYVDDLDRCRPDHVVHMLEAVHLLLALDLFVVVVAVDCRWLMRSLQVHYKDLLEAGEDEQNGGGLRSSTAQNYLEKIFQVTYALAPMNPDAFAQYARYLTGGETMRDERTPVAAGAGPAAAPPTETPQLAAQQPGALPSEPAAPPKPLPPSHAVRITDEEREFLCTIAPLLPTPRIAKRLVNVFRLIKAGRTAEDIEAFERDRSRPCLLMLAILFGRPAISLELFRKLHRGEAPFDEPSRLLIDAVLRRAPEGPPGGEDRQWGTLADDLERLLIDLTVGACAREARETARYSLVTGRDWHTWCPFSPGDEPPKETTGPPRRHPSGRGRRAR